VLSTLALDRPEARSFQLPRLDHRHSQPLKRTNSILTRPVPHQESPFFQPPLLASFCTSLCLPCVARLIRSVLLSKHPCSPLETDCRSTGTPTLYPLVKTGYSTQTTQQPLDNGGNVADSTQQCMSSCVELSGLGTARLPNKKLDSLGNTS
jgi:hypothetical protein